MRTLGDVNIVVIGLGCVGAPLAAEFVKRYPAIGFDVKDECRDEVDGQL